MGELMFQLKVCRKLYVWFDAPIGLYPIYERMGFTRRKGLGAILGRSRHETSSLGRTMFFIAFSIFPAMLKPGYFADNVPAKSEFLNLEGGSCLLLKNWAVWLHEYLEEFPNQQDVLLR
jgi:methionyl-tRNA synthetase